MHYVNLYLTNRAYGGREEGGWWYDTGEPVRSFAFYTRTKAMRCLAMVNRIAECRNKLERRRPPHSVLCDGWYAARIEHIPATAYPMTRPHYE